MDGPDGAPTARARAWAQTTAGHPSGDQVRAHGDSCARIDLARPIGRIAREEWEEERLARGAALARGAGRRALPEEPDPERTCFERDRDRVIHSPAFRRLAGKTQVVVFPTDHQRTRLTHALEVSQVAVSIARTVSANVSLTEAIALAHDCGHGPGGHASEDAFDVFLPGGYDHGPWGADVVLTPLNLCVETLDGVRNHSWSRPAPATVEGEIVSWSDRIAYCAHDLEDAVAAGIVDLSDLPRVVTEVCGRTRRDQIRTFVRAIAHSVAATGQVGMDPAAYEALAALRTFNYERIYTRPESVAQAAAVVDVLRALVEYYTAHAEVLPSGRDAADATVAAVTYVGGMTDKFAFDKASELLGWDVSRLPKGIGRGA
ncbi:HD domain-containing protein [Propionicicella superfundia]|uniref:HD domain-containing protein n=1 Tax=Propionicicella superfundia TaxID=348582 RepID=UPI000423041E|nr:HD domain-containing protein [Propionicicella superfundia]